MRQIRQMGSTLEGEVPIGEAGEITAKGLRGLLHNAWAGIEPDAE